MSDEMIVMWCVVAQAIIMTVCTIINVRSVNLMNQATYEMYRIPVGGDFNSPTTTELSKNIVVTPLR